MDLSFMVIDDTELDHFIARKMIHYIDKTFEVKAFYEATAALDYVKSEAELLTSVTNTLVLLDIYMPMMNAYQFLDAFETLDETIQYKYYIVALTSSHEPMDMNRIGAYKNVKAILGKPVSPEDLSAVISRMITEKGIDLT